jgi:hypothetical protein
MDRVILSVTFLVFSLGYFLSGLPISVTFGAVENKHTYDKVTIGNHFFIICI